MQRWTRDVLTRVPACALLMGALVAASPVEVRAQHEHGPGEHGGSMVAAAQMPLMTSVTGPHSRPITTASSLAQAYFDQGLQMVYAFTYSAAIRSFEEAQRIDPDCAMCYWGEALARGPFINGPMTTANAGPAYAAAQEALRRIDSVSRPVERELIRAMAARYVERHDPEARAPHDSAYANAMAEVYRAHPADTDVGTLYGEALMLLNTARGTYRLGDPYVQSIHRVLESVLERDIRHPGACHLYIHATEATEEPGKAEACANYLGDAIPGASHINHMPSHTFHQIGRWGDAVTSNIRAWHSDQRSEWGEGVSYAASHNLHMLLYAASMDGQGGVAVLAAKEYARAVPNGDFYHALVLHRFGRFEEILELRRVPDQPIQKGLWEFARGYAHLRSGDADSAAIYLARVDEAAASTPANIAFRGHTTAQLLGITGDLLRAEMMRKEGRLDEAIGILERSVERQDGLRYDEPEPLPFAARHWLGAALLEAGRAADAERVYRTSLEKHPGNGWSLVGLEQAIRAQGRAAEADEVRARFESAWTRSDTLIRGSRF